MQIQIVSGIYTDDSPSVRTSYPTNLVPVVDPNGVSNGYLRPADGIIEFATGTGVCRGSILWNDTVYMVMGSKLVSVSSAGVVTTLGDVGSDGKPVSMDYGLNNLAIWSNGNQFYWSGSALSQVVDVDLGTVFDGLWINGYFMSINESTIYVTELGDIMAVNPDNFGAAVVDPDPLKCLLKIRNEVYAVGRHTIEVFRDVAKDDFPFQRLSGGHISRGAIGRKAACVYRESVAFAGSGRREQPGVYLGINANTQKISTREIDEILESYTDAQLADTIVETRNDRSSDLLYVHLPDKTLIYDYMASQQVEQPVWAILADGVTTQTRYRARFMVYAYGKWLVGDTDSSKVGYLTGTVGSRWGGIVSWEFGTQIVYNEGRGAVFNELELVTLTGSIAEGDAPVISTSYSNDGQTWSQDRSILAGGRGDRLKRLVWRRQGFMRSMRMQRFRGDSTAHLSFLRLEAKLGPLNA
jgi:hypothetical protein